MGWKQWTRERLPASDLQAYLQDQTVLQFASANARDAAIPAGSQKDGMVSYAADTGRVEVRRSGVWRLLRYLGAPVAAAGPTLRLGRSSVPVAAPGTDVDVTWTSTDAPSASFSVNGATVTVLERGVLSGMVQLSSDNGAAEISRVSVKVTPPAGQAGAAAAVRTWKVGGGRASGYTGAGSLDQTLTIAGLAVEAGATINVYYNHGTGTATISGAAELTLS